MATLVTGAFGCIGSWVVRRLLAVGEAPVLYDAGEDPWRIRMIVGAERLAGLPIVHGDVADRDRLVALVGEYRISRIIHLAAWQVPLCRRDPAGGARVNVVGTANVFEAARAFRGQVARVVYASSAAVFGPPSLYGPGPLADDAPPRPATHYGVYKVANEETARIHWEEHRVPSVGFRPLSVYGPGRDFGLTADPTLAMKAAVLGRPFRIRWGGSTDLIYVDDVATACLAAAEAPLDGARVYNLHGESAAIPAVISLIEKAWPSAKEQITNMEEPLPFPAALADDGYQRDLGPKPRTGLREGIRRTLEEFARLKAEGRLDARELEADDGQTGEQRPRQPGARPSRITVRPATLDDAAAICTIYNQGIEDRIATLETELRTPEERRQWLASHGPRHPVIVAEAEGTVVGWGSLNVFNPRRAYDFVADFSVYIERAWRGKGAGSRLLARLVELARELGYHKLVLSAFPWNEGGMALYRKLGFRTVGIYKAQGRLDDRWVDTIIMEKILG